MQIALCLFVIGFLFQAAPIYRCKFITGKHKNLDYADSYGPWINDTQF